MGIYYNLKKSLIRAVIEMSLTHLPDTSGTSFPQFPAEHQIHYRTDEGKLYTYAQSTWTEIPLDSLYFDLDSHAVEQQLPDTSFLTTKSFSVSVDEHILEVQCLVGVAIQNDTNLVKHDAVIDALFSAFLPTKRITVYDMVTNVNIGTLQVKNDVEVLPMHKANQRPVQFLGISFVSDLTVDLS